MGKKKVYAVKAGRKTGLLQTWAECQAAVTGYSGAVYKSFTDQQAALDWLNGTAPDPEEEGDTSGICYDVYTDGSFVNGQYAWAYAFVQDDQVVWEDHGVGNNPAAAAMRNVAGELAAAMQAVRKADQLGVRIRIHHDYAGVAFWVTGEWKTQNDYTKAYADFMSRYRGRVEFKKVLAHSGNRFNEYVDQKAKEALGIL